MKKLITSVLVAGFLSGFGNSVTAIPLTWNVNATFNDSSTLTGSYVYDADTSIYSSWNLTTTAGDLVGRNYNPGNSIDYYVSPSSFLFFDSSLSSYSIHATLTNPMTNMGGVINLSNVSECDPSLAFVSGYICFRSRYGEGTVTADIIETPEPTTLSLMGLGLLGFGLSRRKKNIRN